MVTTAPALLVLDPIGAAGIQPIVRLLSSGREAVVVAGAADGGWWGLVCELVKVRVDWKL